MIPEKIKRKKVICIRSEAFANCSSLKSITIPEGVKWIERFAFSGCSGLTSITIPESVTLIGGGAFSGCSNLTNIIVDKKIKNMIAEVIAMQSLKQKAIA